MTSEVQTGISRGAAWMVLFKMFDRSLGLISTLILVRLLTPTDFGIVAMAVAFIAMAEILSAFGFDVALIQNQRSEEQHYHTAWTCNVLLGALITTGMIALAQPVAAFYDRPDVFWIVVALAFGAMLGGFENIGVVAFRKELRFRREFAYLLSKKLVGVAITVPLAFWLRNYWALVIGTLASRLAGTLISYAVHPFRPHWSLARVGDLMTFSRWLLVNNAIIFFKEKSTDFVIGVLQGPRALGLYNVSNELSQLPLTELSAPINRALIPAYSRIQHDVEAINAAFTGSVGVLAILLIPSAAGLCAIAPHLVPVLLGPQWLDAIPLIEWLAIAGGLVALHSPICALIIAKGHPKRVAVCHAWYVLVLLGSLAMLVPRWGSLGAAASAVVAASVATPVYLAQLRKYVGVAPVVLARAVFRPLLAACIMVLVVRTTFPPSAAADLFHGTVSLLEAIAAGAAAYFASLALLWVVFGCPPGAERAVIDRAQRLFAAWRQARL